MLRSQLEVHREQGLILSFQTPYQLSNPAPGVTNFPKIASISDHPKDSSERRGLVDLGFQVQVAKQETVRNRGTRKVYRVSFWNYRWAKE